MVATTSLNHPINISKLIKNFSAQYKPNKFPGAIIRLQYPRSVILLFKSGSVVCTGTKSEEDVQKAIDSFVLNLSKLIKVDLEKKKSKTIIQNMVASCNISNHIRLEQAARVLPKSMYEPEQFPAIIHRVYHPKTVVLIFASGKLVCVGAKSLQNLHNSLNTVLMELSERQLLMNTG